MPNKYLDSVGLAEYTGLIKRDLAPKASPALTGTPTAPTPTAGDDSTKIATTEFVNDAIDTEITSEIAAEVTRADGKYLPFAGGTLTGVVNGVTPTAGDDSTKLATTEFVQEEIRTHANMPIGHEYFTMNPNIPQGSLPLFGGEYSRETYADLWAWVQQQTGYFITDSAWQAMANSQNGNVPFYSDGDGSTTFRVPSLKCWIKGANGTVSEVGSYLEAGLPNITGSFRTRVTNYNDGNILWSNSGGAIYDGSRSTETGDTLNQINGVKNLRDINFDASRSSSIYGNSTTVQPPSIVGMWLVKAYGVVEETGSIDEQQYIDDRIASLSNVYLPIVGGGNITGSLTVGGKEVERVNASGNGYIRYDSGVQLCWGSGDYTNAQTYNVTFPQPFISKPALTNNSIATSQNINAWCDSTKMTFTKQGTNTTTVFYIAIGKWK